MKNILILPRKALRAHRPDGSSFYRTVPSSMLLYLHFYALKEDGGTYTIVKSMEEGVDFDAEYTEAQINEMVTELLRGDTVCPTT